MNQHVWWYTARAGGITAWAVATASVLWGLALSTRALGSKPRAPWLLDLHRFLGGLAIVFTGVHIAGLVADSYSHFGPSEILVPLASSWKPWPVALGVVAFYLLVAIELTSLLKRWLPNRLWHGVHLGSFGLYALSTAHVLLAGTDRTNRGLLAATWGSVLLVTFFTAYRFLVPKGARVAAARARGQAARSTGGARVPAASGTPER